MPIPASFSSELTTCLLPPPGCTISTRYETSSLDLPKLFVDAMTVRLDVFCTEQGCRVANELDTDDGRSWHWVTYDRATDTSMATVRLVPPPHDPHPNGSTDLQARKYIKLSRLAVLPQGRRQGLARALCGQALDWAVRNRTKIDAAWDGLVLVHAQVDAERMWERLGFKTDEKLGRWVEEGIDHLGMWRMVDVNITDELSSEGPRNAKNVYFL